MARLPPAVQFTKVTYRPSRDIPIAEAFLDSGSTSHRIVTKLWQECNWLQAFEGGIDTAHSSFLHRRLTANSNREGVGPKTYHARVTAPMQEVDLTDYGFLYISIRPFGQEGNYVRVYQYVMPFHQLRAYQIDYQLKVKKPEISGHMCNRGKLGFTYTHKEVLEDDGMAVQNRLAIMEANQDDRLCSPKAILISVTVLSAPASRRLFPSSSRRSLSRNKARNSRPFREGSSPPTRPGEAPTQPGRSSGSRRAARAGRRA